MNHDAAQVIMELPTCFATRDGRELSKTFEVGIPRRALEHVANDLFRWRRRPGSSGCSSSGDQVLLVFHDHVQCFFRREKVLEIFPIHDE